MYWENLEGTFTYQTLYSSMVNNSNNAVFVEIGTWKGKSAVFMAEKIRESRKNIKFYTIDLFENIKGYDSDLDIIAGTVLEKYYKNIEPVKNYLETLIGDSKELYKNFENESIDFLFLDGDHTYKGVLKDLQLWFPKVKIGGIAAGHDYDEDSCGVRQAVDQFFGFGAKQYAGGCWIFYK